MLKETQLFENIDKVKTAIDTLRELADKDNKYYVCFSGGKDSIVILDLVKKSGVPYHAFMNLTSVDPKEVLTFVKKNYPDVELVKPKRTMWQLIKQIGMPPTRLMRYCCVELKERGYEGEYKITGIRKAESFKRSKRKMVEFCYKNTGTRYLNIIIDWTDKDVWQYIKENNLPYPSLYDEGWTRIGCLGCPSDTVKHKEIVFHRYPQVRRAYIDAFKGMLETRKNKGLETQWETAEDVMNWWLYGNKEVDDDQTIMFE